MKLVVSIAVLPDDHIDNLKDSPRNKTVRQSYTVDEISLQQVIGGGTALLSGVLHDLTDNARYEANKYIGELYADGHD